MKMFLFLRRRLRLHLRYGSSHVCFLAFASVFSLHLRRTCEPGLKNKISCKFHTKTHLKCSNQVKKLLDSQLSLLNSHANELHLV